MELCEIRPGNRDNVTYAAQLLAEGRLVAFPTETVYGLGADAENDVAVAAIYAAKGRPARNPLIVHVANLECARRYAAFDASALKLAQAFWPGPLTLVLPRLADSAASLSVSAGGPSVALRVPGHPLALTLLEAFGRGVAAPSANRSGRISPTCAEHVAEEFANNPLAPALILDAGATPVGVESTVVECTSEGGAILRVGSLTAAQLERFAPLRAGSARPGGEGALASPGMLESHYAPCARVRLNASYPRPGEAFLAFGPGAPQHEGEVGRYRNLSPGGDVEEAARHLYAYLRELDATGAPCIAVMPIPFEGVGAAINDRLRRAAAERLTAE